MTKSTNKTVGIIGGMGPSATVNLYNDIINLSNAKKDQDNLHVIIDSYCQIPDRTDFLCNSGKNPLSYLINSAKRLQDGGADFLIMACNTAHCFQDEIANSVSIDFLSMIDVAAAAAKKVAKDAAVAVLCTKGTYKGSIYDKYIDNVIYPNEGERNFLSTIIYDYIKKNRSLTIDSEAYSQLIKLLKNLSSRGAEAFILACTELPIAFKQIGIVGDKFIDSSYELAKATVNKAYM